MASCAPPAAALRRPSPAPRRGAGGPGGGARGSGLGARGPGGRFAGADPASSDPSLPPGVVGLRAAGPGPGRSSQRQAACSGAVRRGHTQRRPAERPAVRAQFFLPAKTPSRPQSFIQLNFQARRADLRLRWGPSGHGARRPPRDVQPGASLTVFWSCSSLPSCYYLRGSTGALRMSIAA